MSDKPETPLDPAELAAAEWFLARERGLSSEQETEFARWLAADSRHPGMFAKLQETWTCLDAIPPERVLPPPPLRRRWWLPVGLAAAAVLALGLFFVRPGPPAEVHRTASTPIGGFQRMELPDGSVIRLNTQSTVEVAFSSTVRLVRLTKGEASFDVAKNPARPFVVQAGAARVRAVGTAFNVLLHDHAVEVLVTEGRVQVDDAQTGASLLAAPSHASADLPVLTAGQRVLVRAQLAVAAPPAVIVPVSAEETSRLLAWQNRRLEFSDQPLDAVVAEFNRYNEHQLVIADPALGAQRFGGKFSAGDHEILVTVLERNFNVVAERRPDRTILRSR